MFGTLAWFRGKSKWSFHQLSPEPKWNLPSQWDITAPRFVVCNITVSPEQDLLVLTEKMCVLDETEPRVFSSNCADQPVVDRMHKMLLHTRCISSRSTQVVPTAPPRSLSFG